MLQGSAASPASSATGPALAALVEREGSAAHPYVSSPELNSASHAARNLADAAHYLCLLYGAHPGVVELAAESRADGEMRQWLAEAAEAFARERLFLANLTAAAGPQPSTPGHSESEAAVLAQRHAIETLARSERRGCAFGAVVALILDWRAIRAVLNAAAEKLAVEAPLSHLPVPAEATAVADRVADGDSVRRAIAFGAEQVLVQHRGLWTLLEARQAARGDW